MTAIPGRRRRAPALAFAAQALAGSVRYGVDPARALPEPAGGVDGRRDLRPRPPGVPGGAAPAHRRRGPHHQPFQHDGPYPLLNVVARATSSAERCRPSCGTSACWAPRRRLRAPRAATAVHRQPLPAGVDRDPAGPDRRRHPGFRALRRARRSRRRSPASRRESPRAARERVERGRQSRGGGPSAQGALRDGVRAPLLRGLRIPPRARSPLTRRSCPRIPYAMEAPAPPTPPTAEREPLSLGEIRDIWPLLAHADRIEAFLLLAAGRGRGLLLRPVGARSGRRRVRGAGARAALVAAPPAARRRRRPDPGAPPPRSATQLLALLDEPTRREVTGAARLLGGQRRRPDEPALRAACARR